jgi:hypothetical protein
MLCRLIVTEQVSFFTQQSQKLSCYRAFIYDIFLIAINLQMSFIWSLLTLATSETVLGFDHPDTLASVYCLASLLASCHRYDESTALYERACAGYNSLSGRIIQLPAHVTGTMRTCLRLNHRTRLKFLLTLHLIAQAVKAEIDQDCYVDSPRLVLDVPRKIHLNKSNYITLCTTR